MQIDPFGDAMTARDWETGTAEPLRIGVVGVGWFATDFALPAIAESDYCEATALVTGSPDENAAVAAEFDVDAVLTYEQFHDGEGVDAFDAVYVVTPNATHLEYVESAAAHGKDVIVEKPLEATVERARAAREACEEAGVTLVTAYRMQAAPTVRRVRELVADGFVGDPVQASGAFGFDLLADGDADQWRLDPDLAGGGALYDIGVYPLNTLRFVLDEDPSAVSGTYRSNGEAFAGLDEHVAFQLEFPSGLSAQFRASYNAADENTLTITGTEGRVHMDPAFEPGVPRRVVLERDGRTETVAGVDVNELAELFDYAAHAVATGADVEPDGTDGVVDMEVMAAVYESDESGRRVER
ncbi:MAG: D-xylose 1-dehydrogenase Gfo6 [Halobacteriaceae archaeon]